MPAVVTPIRLSGALIALGVTLLAAACGRGEDVRVALCRDMAETVTDSRQAVVWKGVETRMARFEDLVVTVRFQTTDAGGRTASRTAVCRYAFDDVAEEYNTSSDPVTHYATNPHAMTVDGWPLTRAQLTDTVHAAMARQGGDWLRRLQESLDHLLEGAEGT